MTNKANKSLNKVLYSLLLKRGFDSPRLVFEWKNICSNAVNFFPVRLVCVDDGSQVLYLLPKNKMASVSFAYSKKEMLEGLKNQGFGAIKELLLVKAE